MDPFIRTALDRAAIVRDDLPPRRQRPAPRPLAAGRRRLPQLRQGRDHDRVATGTARPSRSSASRDLVEWATGCGWTGRGSRRSAATAKLPWNLEWAAQWSLFGVTIEPNGKDLATAGGLAGPERRHRPRGVRARAAAQLPVRVPEHRRQEDVDLQGPRGRRAHDRRASCRRSRLRFLFVRHRPESAIEFDPEGTDAIPRLFDEFDRLAAATAGREVKGELPVGLRLDLPLLAARPGADVEAAAARVPAGVRAPRAARPGPGRGRRRRGSRRRRAPR